MLGLDSPPAETGGVLIAREVIQPTWHPETGVTVYMPEQGDAVVEAVEAEESISDANIQMIPVPQQEKPTFRYAPTQEKHVVQVKRFRKDIPRETATQVSRVFGKYISAAKFPSDDTLRLVMDGTAYTFMTWVQGLGTICATTASPEAGTLPAQLVSLGRALFEYAKSDPSHSSNSLDSIQKQVRKLMNDNAS